MVKILLVFKKEVFPIELNASWTLNRLKLEICLLTGLPPLEQKLQGLPCDDGDALLSTLHLHNNHKVLLIHTIWGQGGSGEKSVPIESRFLAASEETAPHDVTANDVFTYIPPEIAIEVFMLCKVCLFIIQFLFLFFPFFLSFFSYSFFLRRLNFLRD
jgi:hypothetical protein